MTAVIKGMISSSDTSSLSATLKNSGIDISEFKNSFKTIMNSLNIPITNSEVNSIISGKITLMKLTLVLVLSRYKQYSLN